MQDKSSPSNLGSDQITSLLAMAFRISPDGLVISRQADGRILEVNESFEKLSGYSREEILGRTVFELNIYRNPADHQRSVDRLRTQGSLRDFEMEACTRTGEVRYLGLSVEPLTIQNEACLLKIFRDITEHKQMELALRASERKYRNLVENLNEGVGLLSSENENLERLVGERTRALAAANHDLAAQIEERKRTQDELRTSMEMFERLFEAAPDAMVLVDVEGIILRANDQITEQFGYSGEQIVGQPIEILIPQRFHQKHLGLRASYYSTPVTRPMGQGLSLYALRKDGSEFPVDITLSPVRIDDHLQVLCAIRDLTSRKQMQAELAEVQHLLTQSREAERLHLARELHDGPMQELSAVNFQLAMLATDLADATDTSPLVDIRAKLDEVNHTLRTMANQLRPPILANLGLSAAMRDHVEHFQQLHSIPRLQLFVPDSGEPVTGDVAFALYRIYQQALNNVIQHAYAQNVRVRLECSSQQILLEIADDGRGFELPATWIELARQNHLGVVGMVERAKGIGGRLEVESAPGKGTTIRVVVPLRPS